MKGNFSASDLKGLFYENFPHLLDNVEDWLDKNSPKSLDPITVDLEDTLEMVVKKLVARRVHRVWVMDDQDQPIGVITMTDVLRQCKDFKIIRGRRPYQLPSNVIKGLQKLTMDVNTLFDDFFEKFPPPPSPASLPVTGASQTDISKNIPTDLIEDDQKFVLICDLPGVEKEGISTSIRNGEVSICAVLLETDVGKLGAHYVSKGRSSSKRTSIQLPASAIDVTQVRANFQDGLLRITVPKKSAATAPKPIAIF